MIKRPKYLFNKELKKEFLQGRSLVYLSEKIGISYSYISSIMQGRNYADDFLISSLMTNIGYTNEEMGEQKDKYFSKII